jgi:hypothetical protein
MEDVKGGLSPSVRWIEIADDTGALLASASILDVVS